MRADKHANECLPTLAHYPPIIQHHHPHMPGVVLRPVRSKMAIINTQSLVSIKYQTRCCIVYKIIKHHCCLVDLADDILPVIRLSNTVVVWYM